MFLLIRLTAVVALPLVCLLGILVLYVYVCVSDMTVSHTTSRRTSVCDKQSCVHKEKTLAKYPISNFIQLHNVKSMELLKRELGDSLNFQIACKGMLDESKCMVDNSHSLFFFGKVKINEIKNADLKI